MKKSFHDLFSVNVDTALIITFKNKNLFQHKQKLASLGSSPRSNRLHYNLKQNVTSVQMRRPERGGPLKDYGIMIQREDGTKRARGNLHAPPLRTKLVSVLERRGWVYSRTAPKRRLSRPAAAVLVPANIPAAGTLTGAVPPCSGRSPTSEQQTCFLHGHGGKPTLRTGGAAETPPAASRSCNDTDGQQFSLTTAVKTQHAARRPAVPTLQEGCSGAFKVQKVL